LSKTSFGAGGFVFEVKTVMEGCLLLLLCQAPGSNHLFHVPRIIAPASALPPTTPAI
jgi:hypothetical protein